MHEKVVSELGPLPKQERFRNTSFVIEDTRALFDRAYDEGVMGLYVRSTDRRFCVQDGRSFVDFVRCCYLGLDNHPAIVAGAIAALQEYNSLHWSCARTRLSFEILGRLESRLSQLFKARIITFSTVMLANLGALPLLASGKLTGNRKPAVVFDRFAHASLAYHKPVVAAETECMTIPHNDLNALEQICRRHSPVLYVADGVYSMGGSAPVAELRELQERYDLYLYLDDAHGISIYGDKGQGFVRSQFGEQLDKRTIIAASLGKGFGASGGMIMMGSAEQEALFRRYAQPYVFSVGPNLAATGAALASAELHDSPELGQLQQRLMERIRFFDERRQTKEVGNGLPIRMIVIGNEGEAIATARKVLDQGFYTSATFFPTVARGAAGIRVCLTASHSFEEIETLCGILSEVVDRALVGV